MARDLRYAYTRKLPNNNEIADVYDGSIYKRLSAPGEFLCEDNHNYSFALWTDGVSTVKSRRKVKIWPFFLQILELSPRAQQRHSLLAAVYVGPRKPQMSMFLTSVAI